VTDAHGWPIHRVARVAGLPEHVLRGYVDRGELCVFKGAKNVYIDVGDLVVVEEIDAWKAADAKVIAEYLKDPAPETVLALVAAASRLVTDSGGLQKEAYWYGVPCVTARPSTEWADTVELGANTLVDDDPDRLAAAVAGAHMPADRPRLYGDGQAAKRIAEALCRFRAP